MSGAPAKCRGYGHPGTDEPLLCGGTLSPNFCIASRAGFSKVNFVRVDRAKVPPGPDITSIGGATCR